jgi:hypothetical protein
MPYQMTTVFEHDDLPIQAKEGIEARIMLHGYQ